MKIHGKVLDSSSPGRGLSGVSVSNGEHVVATDARGGYELDLEPGGHSFVWVTVPAGMRPVSEFYLRAGDAAAVDEVDFECLEDLGFDDVSDAALGHDGNAHCFLDGLDHLRIRGTGNAAVFSDLCRNAFESHDRRGASFFSNASLLSIDDVHDDSAFEHLSETDFGFKRRFFHVVHSFERHPSRAT